MDNNQMLNQESCIPTNIHSEQIKEEFYKWFESRGLLTELRAYMRQLMVKAIEENNKNSKRNLTKKSSTSPKLQAVNLLVVDYLFHEDYFYTVSVFASEAHILDSLPQYSRYVTESVKQRRWNPSSLPRFSRQETEDILDTLHIPPTTLQVRQATDCYLAGRESLLTCIVRSMIPVRPQSSGNGSMDEEEEEDCASAGKERSCSYQLWSEEMQQLLLMAGLKPVHIRRMQHKWAQMIENERQQTRQEVEEEFEAREAKWQRVMEERLQEERAGLLERRSRVEVRERSLADLAEQLSVVHEDVTQRLSQLQLQTDQLDERAQLQEKERLKMQVKMEDLRRKEQSLERALSSNQSKNIKETSFQPEKEKPVIGRIGQQNTSTKEAFVQVVTDEEFGFTTSGHTLQPVTTASTQTLGVAVAASTQTVATEDHELQTSLDQTDPELVSQLEQARRNISELQEENLELRAHILQQRQRIDDLTNRAANLSSQLEESQIAVAVLSGRESGVVASVPNPPPQPPFALTPTFGFHTPQRQGGGEESLFVPRAQQASPRADNRRRPLRFSFSQQPSPTSESSPTDEVIQNARTRIQQLEQESISIQRNFQDFQTRLFTTDSLMFPPLRASRASDPITRVGRSEVSSTFPTTRFYHQPPSFDFSRLIQNRPQHEEHESSSDFYETMRIESLSSSRRLFNQRNIRHFERWKQFKKKFQKRDGSDRRSRALNSNTSSEDDDAVDTNNTRKKHGITCTKRNPYVKLINQDQQTSEFQNENEQVEELGETNVNKKNESISKVSNVKADKEEVTKTTNVQLDNLPTENVTCNKQELSITCPSKTVTSIELDLERSAKLIESVKVLLDAQNIKVSGTSTLSNGSLEVESLPRDSVDNSHIDIGKTDSSIVTVQKANPSKETERGNMIQHRCDIIDTNCKASPESVSVNKPDLPTSKVFYETQTVNQNQQSDNEKDAYLPESNPDKLRSTMPESNLESEELASNFAVTSSDVAEVESGDRATTSLTSGSDILRELNPSKTDSSSSVLSVGFGQDSKHSSDFWD